MSKIKFEDMVEALAKDGGDLIKGLTPETAHLLHMAVGITGEVGELIENVALGVGRENKVEELGDIEFYYQGVMQTIDNIDDYVMAAQDERITGTIDNQLLKLTMYSANLLDIVKKAAIYEKELDMNSLVEQLIYIRKVLSNLYIIFNINKKEAIDANIAKLGKRYASGKFSNKQAQVRADK